MAKKKKKNSGNPQRRDTAERTSVADVRADQALAPMVPAFHAWVARTRPHDDSAALLPYLRGFVAAYAEEAPHLDVTALEPGALARTVGPLLDSNAAHRHLTAARIFFRFLEDTNAWSGGQDSLDQVRVILAPMVPAQQRTKPPARKPAKQAPGQDTLFDAPAPPPGPPPAVAEPEPVPLSAARYELRVRLKGISPSVWRRLDVSPHIRLDGLHSLIQISFGWLDQHLHEFQVGGRKGPTFSPADPGALHFGAPPADESLVPLSAVLRHPGDKMTYTYDLGDNWVHSVTLEKIVAGGPAGEDHCFDAGGAAPEEDSGGTWRWMNRHADGWG